MPPGSVPALAPDCGLPPSLCGGRFSEPQGGPYELVKHLEPIIREKAREKQGERTDLSATLPESKPVDTRQELAKASGLGERTISKAQYIDRHAGEETKEALRAGQTPGADHPGEGEGERTGTQGRAAWGKSAEFCKLDAH